MALQVIGAGMGRTGTASLKLALDMLGFGPCHHMSEVIGNETQTAFWRAIARGEHADWDAVYAEYRAAVDWPTANYWRELAAHYPEAKLILTTRDEEAWYKSFSSTIARTIANSTDPASFGVAVIGRVIFSGRYEDRDHVLAVYRAHNERVRAAIPPDRLLDYQVSEGWAPLCAFLGVPVPGEPFPHRNTTEDFLARRR